jgi:hypothetical protein
MPLEEATVSNFSSSVARIVKELLPDDPQDLKRIWANLSEDYKSKLIRIFGKL